MVNRRVKLIRMEDPYTDLKSGDEGTITGEDKLGHLLVSWDNGSSLHLIPEIDEYKILEKRFIKSFESFNIGINPNKGIKEFKSESSFIESKLEEISDLISSFNATFSWSIGEKDIEINFNSKNQDLKIKWVIEFDKMKITEMTTHNGKQDKWIEKIYSNDEAMDIIEKEIHYWLDISENKK